MRTRYLLATLFTAAQLCAQSTPDLRFGGHTLGETANVFFAIAKTSASKSMTLDYCKSLLNDPRTREKIQAAHESMSQQGFSVVDKQDFSILDVDNCKQVMAAIKGENANVGARLALELGKGGALFAAGKLVAFQLFPDSPYSEVVADMERRFGFQGQEHSVQRSAWPSVKEQMQWEAGDVLAAVLKNPLTDGAIVYLGYLRPPYDWLIRGTSEPQHPNLSHSKLRPASKKPCQ